MNEKKESLKRTVLILMALIVLAAAFAIVASTAGQKATTESEPVVTDQWEYLAVSGVLSNLTPSDNPSMRKRVDGTFRREEFVLEQQMDKLGAKGWELVSVSGTSTDPIFYFKRRK